MRREDIRKLLGGYATGTLTAEERQILFEAALDDQDLFDALAKEQALRELLEDPAARAHLMAALDDGPLPWPRRFERWLWGHAVGLAAVACFLTVGGYVAWQLHDRARPTLIAEMDRQSIDVRESALPENTPRRAFHPGSVTRKPDPAMIAAAPPPVAVPPRAAPASLPMARMALLPPPPAETPGPVSESLEVTAAAPLLMTQTAGGAVGGVAGSRFDAQASFSMAAGQSTFLETQRSARGLYDPALATPALKSESAPAGAGGGGGGAARPRAQADLTSAKSTRPDAAARPAASLGIRYQVLRRGAGGAFEVLPAESDLSSGSVIKLRFIPNESGYLSMVAAGGDTVLLPTRVARLAPVDTPDIRVDRPGPREFYAWFSREEQPPVNGDAYRMRVLQGASGMLSEAAGREGLYVVNPAAGAPGGVPLFITLNFK